MRILLAQNSLYYPAHGGGDKSNRLLVEALAARGHACRAVARISVFGEREEARYRAELAARGVTPGGSRGRGALHAPRRGRARGDQYQPARVLRRAGGGVPAGRDSGFHRRSRAAAAGRGAAAYARARRLPGAGHSRRSLRPRLRLSRRSQNRPHPRLRPRGRRQPIRGRLLPPLRRARRRARAHRAAGAGGMAGAGALGKRVRRHGQPVRGERHRHFPGAGGRVSRNRLRRRDRLGHEPARPRGAGGAAQCAPARPGGRRQPAVRPHARAAGALALGRGSLAHRGRSPDSRRAGDGGERGRDSGSQAGGAVPAAGAPHRTIPAGCGRADGAGGGGAGAGNRPVARGAGAAAYGTNPLRRNRAGIAAGGARLRQPPERRAVRKAAGGMLQQA